MYVEYTSLWYGTYIRHIYRGKCAQQFRDKNGNVKGSRRKCKSLKVLFFPSSFSLFFRNRRRCKQPRQDERELAHFCPYRRTRLCPRTSLCVSWCIQRPTYIQIYYIENASTRFPAGTERTAIYEIHARLLKETCTFSRQRVSNIYQIPKVMDRVLSSVLILNTQALFIGEQSEAVNEAEFGEWYYLLEGGCGKVERHQFNINLPTYTSFAF